MAVSVPRGWVCWVSPVPAVAAGFLAKDLIENELRSAAVIAVTTVVFGVLLWLADHPPPAGPVSGLDGSPLFIDRTMIEALRPRAMDVLEMPRSEEARRRGAPGMLHTDFEAAAAADVLGREVANLVDPTSPVGGEEDFVVLEHVGTPRDFSTEGFEPKDHLELGEALGAIDVERGAKVSGSRFFYLTGPGAELEFALLGLAMEHARRNGLVPVITPALVLPSAMDGTGFLGQAAEHVYRIESDDLYLVGTSEVPLAALHSDEILEADDLPRRYAGWSSCFRREAGSHGKDTRGIIRVHQFDKVEMFVFCDPADADAEHANLLAWEKQFLDALELPYRVIDVATGDLGASAAKKFDIEAWIPTQGAYREVTSTSNTTEYQARRLKIRMRKDGHTAPLATLNGTLCAMPRIIVALLENHQQADGSVSIPAALQPYLGGRSAL